MAPKAWADESRHSSRRRRPTMGANNLLVQLFVEELPPKSPEQASRGAFAALLARTA